MTSYTYEVQVDGKVKETATVSSNGSTTTTQTTKALTEFQSEILQQINYITSQISKFNADLVAANARSDQLTQISAQVNAILNPV